MYLVFTRMPGESYRRRLKSVLLDLCYVFRALNNSLVCSTCIIKCNTVHYVSLSLSLWRADEKKDCTYSITLVNKKFVRSFSLSLSLSLSPLSLCDLVGVHLPCGCLCV